MLVACASCGRHVRASEPRCPFCDRERSEAERTVAAPAPRMVSNRSQLMGFTLATATALAASACGSTMDRGGVDAAYGGPPFDAGMDDAEIRGGVDAAYGGPPFDA